MSTTDKITVVNQTEDQVQFGIDQTGVASGKWNGTLPPGASSGVDVSGFSGYWVGFKPVGLLSQYSGTAIQANNVPPSGVVTLATSVGTHDKAGDPSSPSKITIINRTYANLWCTLVDSNEKVAWSGVVNMGAKSGIGVSGNGPFSVFYFTNETGLPNVSLNVAQLYPKSMVTIALVVKPDPSI